MTTMTPKEQLVYDKIIEGKLTKIIAHEMGIAEITVKVHLRNIFFKFQVKNRNSLIVLDRNFWKERALIAEAALSDLRGW